MRRRKISVKCDSGVGRSIRRTLRRKKIISRSKFDLPRKLQNLEILEENEDSTTINVTIFLRTWQIRK